MMALATVFSSAMVFASCKDDTTTEVDTNDEYSSELAVNNEEFKEFNKVYNAEHSFSYKTTNTYMVKDGKMSYRVVVPEEESQDLTYAKDELSRFFAEATGIKLQFISDQGLTHNASDRYISLGNTTLYRSLNRNDDASVLTRDGTKIFTKDKNVYIIGGQDRGVLYGVYDFLKINFGFEYFYTDCYTLKTGVTNLKLLDYDVTDIPDIEYRCKLNYMDGFAASADGAMISYRLRLRDDLEEMLLPIHMGEDKTSTVNRIHNSIYLVSKEKYGTEHPDFYATSGQLCYTAHGDAEEYELMTTYAAEKVEQSLMWYTPEEFPRIVSILMGQLDAVAMCDCDACKEFKARNNDSEAAGPMKFAHDVGKKVNAWMALPENEPYRRENFKYMFFAYLETTKPSFTLDSNGNPILSKDLTFNDDVIVAPLCAQMHLDTGVSLYDVSNNVDREYYDVWSTAFHGAWAWSYGGFYNNYFTFFDLYSFYSDYYKYLKSNKYSFTNPQIKNCQTGTDTGFNVLALYFYSKLSWNSELNADNIIDEYFDAMYAEASEPMRAMFDDLRLWFARCHVDNNWGWSANMNGNITSSMAYVKQGDLITMFNHLDDAYARIEIYKRDPERYNRLKSHIDMEWLFPAMVAVSNENAGLFTGSEIAEMKTTLKTYIRNFGMTFIREFVSIESFLNIL